MRVLTITDARKQLAALIDAAITDEPTIIARPGGRAAIVVALDEWTGMKETLALLGNPAAARRLIDSIEAADRGDITQHLPPEVDNTHKDVA